MFTRRDERDEREEGGIGGKAREAGKAEKERKTGKAEKDRKSGKTEKERKSGKKRSLFFLRALISLLAISFLSPMAFGDPGTLSSPFDMAAAEAIRNFRAELAKGAADKAKDPRESEEEWNGDKKEGGKGDGLKAEEGDGVKAGEGDKDKERISYLGGICPHHALAFPMIVRFYEELSRGSPDNGLGVARVFLLSPDHFHKIHNYAAVCPEDWSLSDGILEADDEVIGSLVSLSVIDKTPGVCSIEHGVNLHIPMIKTYFPNAKVIPLLINSMIPDLVLLTINEQMISLMDKDTLIILSIDLSHYKTPELMETEDEKTLKVLKELRSYETKEIDVDARRAAALILLLFKDLGGKEGMVLERRDSSFFAGKRVEAGTSYATILYGKED